ncbi:MAG: hypothetical protein ACJA07_000432 [Rhodococcus sp. (in: high G+C Gram-positive bacteria)]
MVIRDHTPNGYPLGARVDALRRAKAAGRVPTTIVELFESDPLLSGWSWERSSARNTSLTVDEKIDLIERYVTVTRIPHVLPSAVVDDPDTGKRIKIGAWLATLKPSSLTPPQRERLGSLVPGQIRERARSGT